MVRAVLAIVVLGISAQAQQPASAAPQTIGPESAFTKSWHVHLPRAVMLEAWERLKNVPVSGAALDQRFKLDGPAYYVSPNGDDGADGSIAHPWKTPQFAVMWLRPGAVINLMAGTYHGSIEIKTKGTEQLPAALRAAPGQEVIVTYSEAFVAQQKARIATVGKEGALGADGKSLHYPSLITVTGSYVEVSGLHLVGVRERLPMNLYSENGISLAGGGGEGCRILYNEIEQTGHCGVKEMGHGGRGILIEGNYIHDLGQTSHDHAIYLPADEVTVRKNLLMNTAGWGVHAYTAPRRLVVDHNIIAGNDQDAVILGGSECKVFNTIFFKNPAGGVFFFRRGCRDNTVVNNIIVGPGPLRFDSLGSTLPADQPQNNTIDHNCIIDSPRTIALPASAGAHNIQAEPQFVDAERLDFRLKDGSPCIGAGTTGVAEKPSGKIPDIGLYETK